jgi:CubicO group peptidase (beta-lactamase class C family)
VDESPPIAPLLPATVRRFDDIVASTQSTSRVPSLVAAVVRDGEMVHFTCAGGHGGESEPHADTQFRIGSITKTMTAALVLDLRDKGALDLDDPLDRHLPGTPLGTATLRQLLCHVSGLQREPDGEWWERSAGRRLDEFLAALTAAKAAHPPYRTYHYSNLAYGLLGAVVTRSAGQPWAELVTSRLLEPLGLHRTTYHPVEPFALGYVVHPWHGTLHEEPRHDAGAMAPAGQLWSTAADLSRWAALLTDPEPAVLSPQTIAEMFTPTAIIDAEWTAGHGLGVQLWRRGERVYGGHTGSMPGYLAVLAVHRPSRTGVVAFANAYTLHGGNIGDLGCELLTAVGDGEPMRAAPWRPATATTAATSATAGAAGVEELTGRWFWMGREYEARWDATRDELVIVGLNQPAPPWRFTREGVDRWRCRSGTNNGEILTVRRATHGELTALDIATFVYTRDPWPPR